MKLIIQIPCFNEEHSLPETLACLPRQLAGIDKVEWLVINDGSTDRTVEVAKQLGVHHIVDLQVNRGLSRAFMAGIKRGISEGADIIVNTDADNQYNAADIPALIAPILERRAEFVIGDRPIATIGHFSGTKRLLQKLGSAVVRTVSKTQVNDAPSGFRAMSREVALKLNVFDSYTYTLESIIQAGLSNMRIVSVPIRVNGETRPSRLVKSIRNYVKRSIFSILRTFFVYQPGRSFFFVSLFPGSIGAFLALRWLVLFVAGTDRSHVPSLIVSAVLLIVMIVCWTAGLLGELIKINRRLLQDVQHMVRNIAANGRHDL